MIKVLDFGISKVNAKGSQQFSLTDTATLMGSPAYMSPEQLESSRNVDGRADIWSLGVILHELILGAVPFGGESVPQLVRAILSGARRKLTDKDPSLVDLEQVVARCLCQDRTGRFQNVAALCEALQPFADGRARTIVGPGLHVPGDAASSARATLDDTPPPRGAHGAAGGVESAWGHTQRGRRGSWQKRGVSVGAIVTLVGLAAYWAWSRDPSAPHGLDVPARPLGSPAARPIEPPSLTKPAAPEPPPPKTTGSPPTEREHSEIVGSASAKLLDETPRISPATPPREAGPAVPTGPHATPSVILPLGASAAAIMKGSASPQRLAPTRAAETGLPGPQAKIVAPDEPPAAPKPPESDPLDKPKAEPSNRNGIDLPDFGGRE
jgi:serine/threonine-protein kinase